MLVGAGLASSHSWRPVTAHRWLRLQGEMERWFENCELRTLVLSDARGEGNLDPLWFPGGRGSLQQEPAAK